MVGGRTSKETTTKRPTIPTTVIWINIRRCIRANSSRITWLAVSQITKSRFVINNSSSGIPSSENGYLKRYKCYKLTNMHMFCSLFVSSVALLSFQGLALKE